MKSIILLFLLSCGTLFAYPSCQDPLLNQALLAIYQLPEGRALIEQVESEGSIAICSAPFKSQSNALWSGTDRKIVLNASYKRPLGGIIQSMFFELHNAAAETKFCQLDRMAQKKMIDKETYIESIERLEHSNAVCTSNLLKKGVRLGLFPVDAKWPVPPHFEQHYQFQKQCGHAGAIGSVYDYICLSQDKSWKN
jgi:hypothetical protein